MIVPGMTATEVANDARKDLKPLANKVLPLCKAQEHRYRTDRKRTDAVESMIQWRSPRGNNWLIVMSTTKKETNLACLAWYRGKDERLRAVRVNILSAGPDIYYSAHLLERYCERFDPNRDPIQRLSEFFFANHSVAFQYTKDLGDGKYEVMCGMLHGNATGIRDEKEELISLTTFLDHGLLGKDQEALSEMLDIKRYFNYMTPGQRAHMIRAVEAEVTKQEARDKKPMPEKGKVIDMMKFLANLGPAPRANR